MATLVNVGGAEMHFICDGDPSPEAEAFANDLGLQFSSDMSEALADPNIEAVFLAAPRPSDGQRRKQKYQDQASERLPIFLSH